MANRKINKTTDDLPFWDLVYELFADEDGLLTLKNHRGEILERVSKIRLRELCADLMKSGREPPHSFYHWWPDVLNRVVQGSIEMTLAKNLSGEDRFVVDPRMVGYLYVVSLYNGPEPILKGADGAKLYAPRFSFIEKQKVPGFAWSKIARTYLKDKYLDGILPARTTQTDISRDALARAAEPDLQLREFMSHSQEDAIQGVRREISRQLRDRQKRRTLVTRAHPPTGDGRLRAEPSAAIDESIESISK